MRFFKYLLVCFLLFYTKNIVANDFPLLISEVVSPNKLTNYNGQKLILLDFWATWCGPCKPATTQLEIMQQQMSNEVFVISITDETHEAVAKYMQKHAIQLMVVRDVAGNLIEKYNIVNRPSAVLLNTSGEIIWQGHPSDLNPEKIKRISRNYHDMPEITYNQLFIIHKEVETRVSVEPQKQFYISRTTARQPSLVRHENSTTYTGSLFELIAKILHVPNHLIQAKHISDFFVELKVPTEIWEVYPNQILDIIHKDLSININPKTDVEEVYFLQIKDKNKLWDTKQINWGNSNLANFMIGEDRVQADNMTLSDFSLLLSNARKSVFNYFGEDYELHDWDLHYLFDNLMEAELLNEYGIFLEKKSLQITRFELSY